MTEGIIQKAFNPYLELITLFPEQRRILEKIQQELIEKIDKTFGYYYIGDREDMKIALIGDNK